MPTPAPRWLKTAHGFSASAIIASFLAWHLANHMTAAFSLETNKGMMDLLRAWYRSDIVQPVLVALFAFQLLSGLRLLWAAIARRADIYSSIQTATGAYLVVFVTSHLIAVFILGRMFLGIDTTFEWASGAPSGLLHDAWNVRLIPHYSLARYSSSVISPWAYEPFSSAMVCVSVSPTALPGSSAGLAWACRSSLPSPN